MGRNVPLDTVTKQPVGELHLIRMEPIMQQATLASVSFERYGKTVRHASFLAGMDRVVPWQKLCQLIEPVYLKPGNGRPPIGPERMVLIYFPQLWFNLSAPGVGQFVTVDLGAQLRNPDQVIGDQIEQEISGDSSDAATPGLAHRRAVLLAPAEDAFDHRPPRLRHPAAAMSCGAGHRSHCDASYRSWSVRHCAPRAGSRQALAKLRHDRRHRRPCRRAR